MKRKIQTDRWKEGYRELEERKTDGRNDTNRQMKGRIKTERGKGGYNYTDKRNDINIQIKGII